MFKILNIQSLSYVSQRPVGGIEKHVRTCVILWSYPLPFQDSPKRFCNVQMWGVWRKEEDKEAPLLPYCPELLNPSVSVYGSIVKHYKGVLSDAEGKIIKETDNLICRHSFCSGESFILIVTGYHTKDVKSCYSLGRDEGILSIQLPSIWHISFSTGMALIGIVERNTPVTCLSFKFLQLLDLVFVELRCQAALALLTHCLSSSIARRTASSSEESMMGFRPRPARVFSPSMPSSLYRFTHAFTDTKLISVCAPAFAAERPSAFRRTARQRIRKQCFSPLRKPLSSSRRCASVNSNTFTFPITNNRTGNTNVYFV